MDIWKLLGIDPTDDEEKIKKAFAERTKEVHPEENPEEFGKLFDAYKRAILQARSRKNAQLQQSSSSSELKEVSLVTSDSDDNEESLYYDELFTTTFEKRKEKVNIFSYKLGELRIRHLSWKKRNELTKELINHEGFSGFLIKDVMFKEQLFMMIKKGYFVFFDIRDLKDKIGKEQQKLQTPYLNELVVLLKKQYDKNFIYLTIILSSLIISIQHIGERINSNFGVLRPCFLVICILFCAYVFKNRKRFYQNNHLYLQLIIVVSIVFLYLDIRSSFFILIWLIPSIPLTLWVKKNFRYNENRDVDLLFLTDNIKVVHYSQIAMLKGEMCSYNNLGSCRKAITSMVDRFEINDIITSIDRTMFYDLIWADRIFMKPFIHSFYKAIKDKLIKKQMNTIDEMFWVYLKYQNYMAQEGKVFTFFCAISLVIMMWIEQKGMDHLDTYDALSRHLPLNLANYLLGIIGLIVFVGGIVFFYRRRKLYSEYRKYFDSEYLVLIMWLLLCLGTIHSVFTSILFIGIFASAIRVFIEYLYRKVLYRQFGQN